MSVLKDSALEELLAGLHARSDVQVDRLVEAHARGDNSLPPASEPELRKAFLSDKLVALDRGKAELCYQLLRGLDARRVVEIGTSYGVSTLYLAAALRDNCGGDLGIAIVVGTEYEPEKARHARRHLKQAGLADLVDLREGDLRDTLRNLEAPIDFVLMDIWTNVARDALALVYPHLRPGAMIVCDNTNDRDAYADYFAFIEEPANHFRTMTLPFKGGLELSVFCPPSGPRRAR